MVRLLGAYLLPILSEMASGACPAPAVAAAVHLQSWQGPRPQICGQTGWNLAQLSTGRQHSSSALQNMMIALCFALHLAKYQVSQVS